MNDGTPKEAEQAKDLEEINGAESIDLIRRYW